MDPFTIITGVISLATAGLQASKKLYELLDNVQNGPEEIISISQDSRALFDVINSLEMALKKDDMQTLISEDKEIVQAIENLSQPLRNCRTILDQLTQKLNGRLKRQSDGQGLRMGSFDLKWGMIVKNQVNNILRRLESNKATLNAGTAAITTIISVRMTTQGKGDVAREIKRSSGATDAGYALRRYLAESVLDRDSPDKLEPTLKFPRSPSLSPSERTLFVETPAQALARSQRQRDELHTACTVGDTLVIARLLAEGADPNIPGPHSRTALFHAIENSHSDAALLLLEHAANINARYVARSNPHETKFVDGRTPLIWAATRGLDEVVRKLLELGADVNAQNSGGRYAMQEAIREGYPNTAKILLEEGNASISITDKEDWTPLHQSADQGFWDVGKMLVERGADLEARSSDHNIWGWMKFRRATPLLIATEADKPECVKGLLEAGADAWVQNVDREMPVHVAARRGLVGVVKVILEFNLALGHAHTVKQETPLVVAINHERVEVVEVLVQKDPECREFVLPGAMTPMEMVRQRVGKGEGNRSTAMVIQGLLSK